MERCLDRQESEVQELQEFRRQGLWPGTNTGVESTAGWLEFFIAWERMNHHPRSGSRRPILQLPNSCLLDLLFFQWAMCFSSLSKQPLQP